MADKWDHWRLKWIPDDMLPWSCGHCDKRLEYFQPATPLPGNFHHPNRTTWVCHECTPLFFKAEEASDQQAMEAGYG